MAREVGTELERVGATCSLGLGIPSYPGGSTGSWPRNSRSCLSSRGLLSSLVTKRILTNTTLKTHPPVKTDQKPCWTPHHPPATVSPGADSNRNFSVLVFLNRFVNLQICSSVLVFVCLFVFSCRTLTLSLYHFINSIFKQTQSPITAHKPLFHLGQALPSPD